MKKDRVIELELLLELILKRYYQRKIGTINDLEVDTIIKIEKALRKGKSNDQR